MANHAKPWVNLTTTEKPNILLYGLPSSFADSSSPVKFQSVLAWGYSSIAAMPWPFRRKREPVNIVKALTWLVLHSNVFDYYCECKLYHGVSKFFGMFTPTEGNFYIQFDQCFSIGLKLPSRIRSLHTFVVLTYGSWTLDMVT